MEYMYPDLNRNVDRREQIIFGEEKYDSKKYPGGIRCFCQMSYDTLKKLVEENFVYVEDRQNDAPSIAELMQYAEKYPNVTFDGYAVELMRDDYRISIETVRQNFGNSKNAAEAVKDFSNNFHAADEFRVDEKSGYAWWD